MRVMWVLATALTLGGCGSSPPTRFYTLDAVAPQSAAPQRIDTPVKVAAVHIPAVLDRRSIVRGKSGNELQISSRDRWGGDFGEMARRVLTQDLEQRLPSGLVIAPDSPAPDNARGIVVEILSFEPTGAGQLVLDADWTLLQGSPPHPQLQRSFRLAKAVGNSAGSEAAAMSTLLGKLADEIAQGVSQKLSRTASN
jgi:uncharacterized protein